MAVGEGLGRESLAAGGVVLKMDCLLTHAYFLAEDEHEREIMRPYAPLGILYIASHLERAGLEIEVFDTTFATWSDFESELDCRQPPIVGLYCNLMTRARVVRMMAACRSRNMLVVVGGPEASSYAEEYLDHGADVVVEGEGELTMAELIPRLLESGASDLGDVSGIWFRGGDGELVRTETRAQIQNLDAQPFPAREKIDIPRYLAAWRAHHGAGSVSMITARGCPYRCSWCSHGVYGFTHRRRSPTDVADELEMIIERYEPEMIWYADDVFTIHHRWLRDYAAELSRRGIKIPFETISREDRLDEAVIELLAEMGCFRLWIGSESGSQRILDAMSRRTDAHRVCEMVHCLQRHGIEAGMFIMLGYEGEEESDLHATVENLKTALPDRFLTTVSYPIKGTAYYQQVADRIVADGAWATTSDRDLTIVGRRSARYYRHVTRWMVNEVNLERYRREPRSLVGKGVVHAGKCLVGASLGRVGMMMYSHEREHRESSE